MSKKNIIIFSIVILSTLAILNIYLYTSNNNINSMLKDSSSKTELINDVSNFRTDVNKMSQSYKLYLITSKDEYKNEYNSYLSNLYSTIDNLEKDGLIQSKQKQELINALNNYKTNNENLINENNEIISSEMEQMILQSNNAQLSVLDQFDLSIEEAKSSIREQNNSIISSTDNQKNGVQAASGIITAVTSIFIYIIKNPLSKHTVNDILDCIEDKEEQNNKTNDMDTINKISEMKDEICEYDKKLEVAKLICTQNSHIVDSIYIVEKNIYDIEKLLIQLSYEVSNSGDDSNKHINEVQKQVNELRILLESLKMYNAFTLEICNTFLDKDKD